METNRSIYIVLSRTQTGFARALRIVGRLNYNHAAIALDPSLTEMYAFARSEQYGFLTAKLVRETTDRYLVHAKKDIPILVYEIPVTEEQLGWVRSTIERILADPKYIYNLFSVLTYPVLGGFATYKAFTCIEFVAYILQHLGYDIPAPLPHCRPDDLLPLLDEYLLFDGNLLDYTHEYTTSKEYFRPVSLALVLGSVVGAAILLRRSLPGIRRWRRK